MAIHFDCHLFQCLLECGQIGSEVFFELHSGSRLWALWVTNVSIFDIERLNPYLHPIGKYARLAAPLGICPTYQNVRYSPFPPQEKTVIGFCAFSGVPDDTRASAGGRGLIPYLGALAGRWCV